MIKVGIIGTGIIAGVHAKVIQNLSKRATLHAVADIVKEKADAFADEYGAKVAYRDYHDLLADDATDMVCICTPAFNHAEIAMASVQAGKAVLCEKPIAGSLQEIDSIRNTAKEYGGVVSSIFPARYGQGIKVFRELQDDGIAGRLLFGRADVLWRRTMDYYNQAAWRGTWKGEMGGALITLAIHAIDVLCSVSDRAKSVYSIVGTLNHDIETDDTSTSALRFEDDSVASINVTTNNQIEETSLKFICENVVAVSNTRPYLPTAWPWTFTSANEDTQRQINEHIKEIEPSSKDASHEWQINDFINHLERGKKPPVTTDEVRYSLEVITGIYKSGLTGEVVNFPIEKDDSFYNCLHGLLYT